MCIAAYTSSVDANAKANRALSDQSAITGYFKSKTESTTLFRMLQHVKQIYPETTWIFLILGSGC